MAAIVFNIAKGKVARYADLPNANDALIAVLLVAAGLESDAALQDYDTLAAVLAAANDEATFTGYSRQVLTAVGSTPDDTNNRMDTDAADPSWSPTTAQALGKILICYDPDTTGGTDTDIIPLTADDYVVTTPTSGTISYQVAAAGFFRAS